MDDGGEPPLHGHARLGAHQPLHRPDAARGRATRADAEGRGPAARDPRRAHLPTCRSRSAPPRSRTATPGANLPKDDKIGRNVLGLIAGDETKHYLFYRDLTLAAFAIDPSTMMIAVGQAGRAPSPCPAPGSRVSPGTRCASRVRASTGSVSTWATCSTPVLSLWDVGAPAGALRLRPRPRASTSVVSSSQARRDGRAHGAQGLPVDLARPLLALGAPTRWRATGAVPRRAGDGHDLVVRSRRVRVAPRTYQRRRRAAPPPRATAGSWRR